MAIRANEAGSAAALRAAQHAEGAVMAAAGSSGIGAARFVTVSLWKPAGFAAPAKAAESIAALGAQLQNPPDGPSEIDQAAAAARAAIVKGA